MAWNFSYFFTLIGTRQEQTQDTQHTLLQTHNLSLVLFLSKTRPNSNEVRMCHGWFRIDYFRLNLHLIIEILVHNSFKKWIYYCEIIMLRNNSVNYLKFCPPFNKDCLHFWKCDTSVPPLWRVPITNVLAIKLPSYTTRLVSRPRSFLTQLK